MTRVLFLVGLVGACNRTLGLDDTKLLDGRPIDAPPSCDRELVFAEAVHQVIIEPCTDYVPAADIDRALALCNSTIAEGPIDQPLAPMTVAPHGPGSINVYSPRLAPEGDRAFVVQYRATLPSIFSVYTRDAAGWSWSYDVPITSDFDDTIGTPSRGPVAHAMYARPNSATADELVEESPGNWRVHATYQASELATEALYASLNLSADGLHLIFTGSMGGTRSQVLHAARASIDDRFPLPTPLLALPPGLEFGFMTPSCARVYFTGLESVFYSPQQ